MRLPRALLGLAALSSALMLPASPSSAARPGLQATHLRCENLTNPLGVDARTPRLSWWATADPADRGQRQTAYRIQVASTADRLAAGKADLWDNGKVASSRCAYVPYAGRPLRSNGRCWWRVSVWDARGRVSAWSTPAFWSVGLLSREDWRGKWLAYTPAWTGEEDLGAPFPGRTQWPQKTPSPVFRKEFTVTRPVRWATLTVCGLGYHEARLNSRKVGDHVLDPAFTRYDKRCLYVTHDVTGMLKPGRNAIGLMLGNGFFNPFSRDAWDFTRAPWRDRPRVIAQVRIEYADGSTQTVATDETWRASSGPVVRDGIRNGELYDARREMPGWDAPGFDDRGWASAEVVPGPRGALRAQTIPIRMMQTLKPRAVTEPRPGVFVVDMGQAFAGWAQLRVSGPAGTRVTLRYAEKLDRGGNLDQSNIATLVHEGPFQTDAYILHGGGLETWEPRFTYHGFRYVEVTGFPGRPTLDSLRGRVVHTAFEPAGSFTCSNGLLNDIQRLTGWSYLSNFVGIPTDCPHREKNGWTGDAQLACEQAMLNWDNAAGYEQWLNDFDDEQRPDGALPGIMPTSGWGYQWGNGPAWDSAYVLIPWYLYRYTGDTRALADHYAGMKRYVDYMTSRAKDGIVDFGLGDWVPWRTQTAVSVTSTGYYYADTIVLANAARLLDRTADADRYAHLAEGIRAGFDRAFVKPDGAVANSSQTALSCAVYQGLAPAKVTPKIVDRLAQDLASKQDHIDTGILGAKYLFHTLTDNGRHDLAYRVATQTTLPSYGWWVKQGATTLWEDWGGGASLDHIMFGDISNWFYRTLAGLELDPDVPGYRRFVVHPRPVGDLAWVKAWHDSPYGRIGCAWSRANGQIALGVTIPAGTTAVVWVPTSSAASVAESGRPAAKAHGARFLRSEPGAALYEVQSGRYTFTAKE